MHVSFKKRECKLEDKMVETICDYKRSMLIHEYNTKVFIQKLDDYINSHVEECE